VFFFGFPVLSQAQTQVSEPSSTPTSNFTPVTGKPTGTANEFDKAFNTYRNNLEKYNKARDSYLKARTQYFAFDTLTSRNNAKEATKSMLRARDEVIISYFDAVKKRVDKIPGMEDFKRNGYKTTLDGEMSWYREHKSRLDSAGALEDLADDSLEAYDRWILFRPTLYLIISDISRARVNDFYSRFDEIFVKLREKVLEIRNEEREDYKFDSDKLARIDRGIFETQSRIERSRTKFNTAVSTIELFSSEKLRNKNAKLDKQYDNIILYLSEAVQDMKDANLFLKEIIREIRTK